MRVCLRSLDSINGNISAPTHKNFQKPIRAEIHAPEGMEKIMSLKFQKETEVGEFLRSRHLGSITLFVMFFNFHVAQSEKSSRIVIKNISFLFFT